MGAFELPDLDRQRVEAGKLYLEFLRVPALSLGLYVLPAGGVDAQQPHKEEEVYYAVSGRAMLRVDDEDRAVQPSSGISRHQGWLIRFVPSRRSRRFWASSPRRWQQSSNRHE